MSGFLIVHAAFSTAVFLLTFFLVGAAAGQASRNEVPGSSIYSDLMFSFTIALIWPLMIVHVLGYWLGKKGSIRV